MTAFVLLVIAAMVALLTLAAVCAVRMLRAAGELLKALHAPR